MTYTPPTLDTFGYLTEDGANYLLGIMVGNESCVDRYYLALSAVVPTVHNSAEDLEEPQAADYARLPGTAAIDWMAYGGAVFNDVDLTFTATSDWGQVRGWALLDSPAGGRVLFAGFFAEPVELVAGAVTYPRGSLAVAMSVMDWAISPEGT